MSNYRFDSYISHLSTWLANVAKKQYGNSIENGFGWLLPDELAKVFSFEVEHDTMMIACNKPEYSWLVYADSVFIEDNTLCCSFNYTIFSFTEKIHFVMPIPKEFTFKRVAIGLKEEPFSKFFVLETADKKPIGNDVKYKDKIFFIFEPIVCS